MVLRNKTGGVSLICLGTAEPARHDTEQSLPHHDQGCILIPDGRGIIVFYSQAGEGAEPYSWAIPETHELDAYPLSRSRTQSLWMLSACCPDVLLPVAVLDRYHEDRIIVEYNNNNNNNNNNNKLLSCSGAAG